MKSPRRRAREFAVQALYQWLLAAPTLTELKAQYQEAEGFARADKTLFEAILSGATQSATEIGASLTPYLDRNWVEVSPIEKAILLVGAHELMSMPETPYRVIINESIELAKIFGGTDGHRYVNGVLDKLAATVRVDEVAANLATNPQRPARAR